MDKISILSLTIAISALAICLAINPEIAGPFIRLAEIIYSLLRPPYVRGVDLLKTDNVLKVMDGAGNAITFSDENPDTNIYRVSSSRVVRRWFWQKEIHNV